MPLFVTGALGGDSRHLGFMMAGIGIGALAGALFIAFKISIAQLPAHTWHMQVLFGVSLLLYGLATNWGVALAITPVLGFSLVSSLVSNNSLIQALVDEDKRGRVLSYYSFGLLGFGPLGALLGGKLADHTDVRTALMVCAVLSLALGVAHAFRQKAYDASVPEMLREKGLS